MCYDIQVRTERRALLKDKDKKKRFKLFDLQRDGKGISKKEPVKESGLKRFFITYKENFGKMVSANMFFVIGNFPIIFLIITLSGYTKLSGYFPLNDVFQNLGGLFAANTPTPFTMSLYALEGLQNPILVDTTLTYIFYALAALTVFTFGIVNVGTAYILRNIAMGEPVFVWSDFWYAVKRNWKQALPFGIIDALIHVLLVYNIYTTLAYTADFLMSMMFWGNILIAVLYFSMRCYIYVQMVTFKLTVFKIIKNSLIFVLLGLKRNMMALLGTLLLVFLEFLFLFSAGGILLPLAIAFPLTIMVASMAYMKVYASYFKIKEIMILPYMEEHPEEFPAPEDDEVIMRDDVTERERLDEIKKRNNINE